MTTSRQIKNITRSIVSGNPDLAFAGAWLVLTPVTHLVRGILIDRTRDADTFKLRWSVVHLFEPRTTISLNLGQEIYNPESGLWRWNHPGLQHNLTCSVEEEVLPLLRTIATLEDYLLLIKRTPLFAWNKRPLQKLIVDIAMGDFDAARAICRDVISRYTPETFPGDAEDKAHFADLKKLCAMLAADDREGMAAILHAWEAQTVKNLKLEHLWQSTPFPFELAAH